MKEDVLIVVYEENYDMPMLVVGRKTQDGVETVSSFKNDKAEELYKKLTDEYNNGWIPCKERLPEENAVVLTCDKEGWISVNVYMPYMGAKNDFECGYYEAWRPLPEPYKSGVEV